MSLTVFLRAIRIHQWVKNLLLFVPIFTAHRYLDFIKLQHGVLAFFSFGLCASSVYLINDMIDIEADKAHERKRMRPIASGLMSLTSARWTAALFLFIAIFIAQLISIQFVSVLVSYFIITTAYSFFLKQQALVDIITLSLLYTIRVIAGGIATGLEVSQWLIGFSLFFFVSLACVKRFSELWNLRLTEKISAAGRGYVVDDLELISQFGLSTGCVAVLVFALYVTSSDVTLLYRFPRLLWLICPLLLFWISRLWLLAHRGLVHDDPIVFAIRDRVSYIVGLLAVGLLMCAA
jgi:4-hydroxybenzoate polyprenyltransferase